ncbi:hypothetical protein Bpla01_12880 [Burkholderia plantarii]|nr:hypothetical protein Bpla01_12880 [Burkholderia plantarii]
MFGAAGLTTGFHLTILSMETIGAKPADSRLNANDGDCFGWADAAGPARNKLLKSDTPAGAAA